jgi:hypothetical protein
MTIYTAESWIFPLYFVAIVALGHGTSVILNRITKLFPILACRVTSSAVPVRLPGNGLVIVTLNALPIKPIWMLLMFKYDIRPFTAQEGDGRVGCRNLNLLAGPVIRNTTLSQESDETKDKSYFQRESPHKTLLWHNPRVVPTFLRKNHKLAQKGGGLPIMSPYQAPFLFLKPLSLLEIL